MKEQELVAAVRETAGTDTAEPTEQSEWRLAIDRLGHLRPGARSSARQT